MLIIMSRPVSLLNNENHLLQLNKELGEKVKNLMSDVDLIISHQESIMRAPKKISAQWLKKKTRLNCEDECQANNGDLNESITTEENILNDNDIENERKRERTRSTNATIIRFLKAQIIKCHTDLQSAQMEIKKKDERCKKLEIVQKKIEEKRDKLQNQISIQKESIIKANAMNLELQSKVQSQGTEINFLRKVRLLREVEELNKDLKTLNQLVSNNDVRLNRCLDENEKLKSTIKINRTEDKELRDQIRKVQEEKRILLKNFEKQQEEIFQAFKKQTSLVDNLKKQTAYLEASKEIQFVEEDFTKLLDWQPDKV